MRCLSHLEDHHDNLYLKNALLATISGHARKVGVVSIIKMADLKHLNPSSSSILSKKTFKVAKRIEELLKAKMFTKIFSHVGTHFGKECGFN